MNSYYENLDRLKSDINFNRSNILEKDRRNDDFEEQLLASKKEVMTLCLYSKFVINQ
jgi:hypothetical protein